MRTPAPARTAVGTVTASLLLALACAAVFVVGPASASPTTTSTTTTTSGSFSNPASSSPASHFFVVNGTANAASDHEIVGSSAFPNFTSGAVDNYYSLGHAHVDNAPFAEGTASPADSGPVGQTAAAGNFQQPQYADARWPGDPGKATYGNQGGPYAVAEASDYRATAAASVASIPLSGPSMSTGFAAPKGFDGRLRQALAAWEAKWLRGRLGGLGPAKPPATPAVPTPAVTVTTPLTTITAPTATIPGVPIPSPPASLPASAPTPPPPPPPATVPLPNPLPSTSGGTAAPSRSLASNSTASSAPADGVSHLESSTLATLDPKTNTLVTSGESRLGRVSLGGGQIVIEGIHVVASIANDGTPTDHESISIAAASIGGVPVTIDQDGVHVAGQGQGAPYKQASDALNGALKQAGIQLFLVAPEVRTTGSCDQTGSGGGTDTGTTTTTTTNDQSGTSSCGQPTACDQTGSGTGTGTGTTNTTTTNSLTGTTSTTSTTSTTGSCDQTTACDQTGSGTGTGTTDTTTTAATTTTSGYQTGTTSTGGWCDQMGMTTTTPTGSCTQAGTGTTTSPNGLSSTPTDTTSTTGWGDQTSMGPDTTNAPEETVTATGLHIVFTQPVGQSGVPAQNAEHILGEVFLDSLAVPAPPLTNLNLGLNSDFNSTFNSNVNSGSYGSGGSASCLGGHHGSKSSGLSGGGSSLGGTGSSGSPSGFASGVAGSQLASSSTGSPMASALQGLASFLRSKPLWVLIAFLVWQALAVVTGASLRAWRREGAS